MLQTVSVVGTSLVGKREKAKEKELTKKKKPWGPFQYFVIASSFLIVVMWGVIIFGGEDAPGSKIDFQENSRVFLFMVDSSIKRYRHFEGNKYPEKLIDIVPKYLSLAEEDLIHLEGISYERDPIAGYFLSFANPKPGEMNIIISPKGIKYESSLSGETTDE